MRITTWNVNGLRATLRKGFAEVVARIDPDVLLLQEIRVRPEQLPAEWAAPEGWHVFWRPAERPGYAGTAIWSRRPMRLLNTGLHDEDGRVLHARVGRTDVASVYLPSGSSGPHRQGVKDLWLPIFADWAAGHIDAEHSVILGGDLNVAHTARDIFHAKANEKTSGFLPHEREWMQALLAAGWSDYTRRHFGDRAGPYSWWSNRGRARELDRGWRIDYLLGNRRAAGRLKSVSVDREAALTVSDHAPVTVELKRH